MLNIPERRNYINDQQSQLLKKELKEISKF
mgnify:CR=1 FL=1